MWYLSISFPSTSPSNAPSPYSVVAANTNECTIGFQQMTHNQCKLYADSISTDAVIYYDSLSFLIENIESPKGCQLNYKENAVNFNDDAIGGSNPDISPVCVRK